MVVLVIALLICGTLLYGLAIWKRKRGDNTESNVVEHEIQVEGSGNTGLLDGDTVNVTLTPNNTGNMVVHGNNGANYYCQVEMYVFRVGDITYWKCGCLTASSLSSNDEWPEWYSHIPDIRPLFIVKVVIRLKPGQSMTGLLLGAVVAGIEMSGHRSLANQITSRYPTCDLVAVGTPQSGDFPFAWNAMSEMLTIAARRSPNDPTYDPISVDVNDAIQILINAARNLRYAISHTLIPPVNVLSRLDISWDYGPRDFVLLSDDSLQQVVQEWNRAVTQLNDQDLTNFTSWWNTGIARARDLENDHLARGVPINRQTTDEFRQTLPNKTYSICGAFVTDNGLRSHSRHGGYMKSAAIPEPQPPTSQPQRLHQTIQLIQQPEYVYTYIHPNGSVYDCKITCYNNCRYNSNIDETLFAAFIRFIENPDNEVMNDIFRALVTASLEKHTKENTTPPRNEIRLETEPIHVLLLKTYQCKPKWNVTYYKAHTKDGRTWTNHKNATSDPYLFKLQFDEPRRRIDPNVPVQTFTSTPMIFTQQFVNNPQSGLESNNGFAINSISSAPTMMYDQTTTQRDLKTKNILLNNDDKYNSDHDQRSQMFMPQDTSMFQNDDHEEDTEGMPVDQDYIPMLRTFDAEPIRFAYDPNVSGFEPELNPDYGKSYQTPDHENMAKQYQIMEVLNTANDAVGIPPSLKTEKNRNAFAAMLNEQCSNGIVFNVKKGVNPYNVLLGPDKVTYTGQFISHFTISVGAWIVKLTVVMTADSNVKHATTQLRKILIQTSLNGNPIMLWLHNRDVKLKNVVKCHAIACKILLKSDTCLRLEVDQSSTLRSKYQPDLIEVVAKSPQYNPFDRFNGIACPETEPFGHDDVAPCLPQPEQPNIMTWGDFLMTLTGRPTTLTNPGRLTVSEDEIDAIITNWFTAGSLNTKPIGSSHTEYPRDRTRLTFTPEIASGGFRIVEQYLEDDGWWKYIGESDYKTLP